MPRLAPWSSSRPRCGALPCRPSISDAFRSNCCFALSRVTKFMTPDHGFSGWDAVLCLAPQREPHAYAYHARHCCCRLGHPKGLAHSTTQHTYGGSQGLIAGTRTPQHVTTQACTCLEPHSQDSMSQHKLALGPHSQACTLPPPPPHPPPRCPQAHKERLLDLSGPELLDLFRTGVALVQELGARHFAAMILNQGSARSHAHLHLKVGAALRAWPYGSTQATPSHAC